MPRNHTLVVERQLRIRAAGTIEIDGAIELEPGAGLSIDATHVIVRGQIVPVSPGRLPLSALGRPTKVPVDIQPNQGQHNIVIDEALKSEPSQSIVIAVRSSGTITVTGTVETADGTAATSPQTVGGNAGDIVMNAGPFDKVAKITIAKGALVRAGDGGQGYWDKAPEETPPANPCGPDGARNAVTLIGTDGGDGGSIKLSADTIVDKGKIQVGDGGAGGRAGTNANAPSGGNGQGGVDFHARSGRGGNGGSIETTGNPLEDTINAGAGGDGGDVTGGAGNGGPHCDGGRTTVTLGDVGRNGETGKTPERQPSVGRLSLNGGGRGGNAEDAKHAGGDGGATVIRLPEDHRSGPIDITSYGNGGRGFDACGNATTNATAGGDAAALNMTGSPRASAYVDDSFDGGDGGDGHPPGLGGEKGATSAALRRVIDSFQAGDPGLPCGTRTRKKKKGSVTSVTTTTTKTSSTATTTTAETTTSSTAGTGGTYRCSGKQITLFDNTNGGLVNSGGAPPSFNTGGKAYCVTYIQTYHWNSGSGAPPGTLGLKRSGGTGAAEVGPFPAKASPGANNAPNVNWYVYVRQSPPQVIDGSYTCSDSGATTWSANSSSGGAGFCIVYAVPAVKG